MAKHIATSFLIKSHSEEITILIEKLSIESLNRSKKVVRYLTFRCQIQLIFSFFKSIQLIHLKDLPTINLLVVSQSDIGLIGKKVSLIG